MYHFEGGLWWYCDQLYVPTSLGPMILSDFRDSPSTGHPGIACILSCLSHTYSWPNIQLGVVTLVGSFDSCQHTKIDTKASMWALQPLPIPDCPWSVISMDFIFKTASSNLYDSVLFLVYPFTKGAHFRL